MANTMISKLAGAAAVAAIALSTLAAPGAASASTPRVHQTAVSVFSVASQRAAARQRAGVSKMRNLRAHKVVQQDMHADRQRMLRLAAAKRAALAAHRRRVVVTQIKHNRAYKKH